MTGIQEKESHFRHVPVLVEEVLQYAPEGCRAAWTVLLVVPDIALVF